MKDGEQISGFEVIKQLGEGTFGIVYKVRELSTGRIAALKILKLWEVPPDFREQLQNRFKLEYETGQIESNYLVHTTKSGEIDGNPFIIMEFCPHGDLREKIGAGHVPFDQIHKIAGQILLGLNDLHKNGKIHRDLKPDNILFDDKWTARLTDFGITGHANLKFRLTVVDWKGVPKEILGTYAYMPPEQIRPVNKHVTLLPTTDIFAFGVILFESLTGRYPYGPLATDSDLANYIQRMKKGEWEDLKVISKIAPANYVETIERCLDPNYKTRFQSAEEVLSKIGKTLHVEEDAYDPKNDRIALKIMQGEEYGKIYTLSDFLSKFNECVIQIGRKDSDERKEIEILEELTTYISRRHATLERWSNPDGWFLRDGQWSKEEKRWKNSLNGTFVNSMKIDEHGTMITPGDIITLGDTTLKVIIP